MPPFPSTPRHHYRGGSILRLRNPMDNSSRAELSTSSKMPEDFEGAEAAGQWPVNAPVRSVQIEDAQDSVPEVSPQSVQEPKSVFLDSKRHWSISERESVLGSGFGSVIGSESNRLGIFHTQAVKTSYTTKVNGTEDELVIVKRQSRLSLLAPDAVIEKPWLKSKTRRRLKYLDMIFCVGVFVGIGIIGLQVYFAWALITNFDYCEVLVDNFETFREDFWTREVQVGGFGNGAFDWTTNSERNSYVKGGKLYILPTLTNETLSNEDIVNGYTVNLTADGTCTGSGKSQCWVSSNRTKNVVIPPVQSARLNTKVSASIKYGKIEIRAKMPRGDWLWPALWLLPVNDTYGGWPASGEIDIAESRGNGVHYAEGGYDQISSTLHWGPSSTIDGYLQTFKSYTRRIGMFDSTYHTFGLEWSDKYIKTYVDRRLQQVFYHKFNKPFWQIGKFQTTYDNGTYIQNPWPANNPIAPFDQEFFLILNVAVGGTNGFFPDNMGNKPWINSQEDNAASSFWSSVDSWYNTWPKNPDERAMIVDFVKIYKICDKKK